MKKTKKEKVKTKVRYKIIMILLSIILTLFLLEILLRTIGFIYLNKNQNNIENSLSDSHTYTILCIGESTTAGQRFPDMSSEDISYPTQLHKILNSMKLKKNVKVINDGIPGATTFTLLTRLENNIKTYQPDLIISMIGTNDTGVTVNYNNKVITFILSKFLQLKISQIFIKGPLKFLKYSQSKNVFSKNKNSVREYYNDKIGHYTINIEPITFLHYYGFPIKSKHLNKSMEHYNNGRINDALAEGQAALQKDPDELSIKLYLAEIHYQLSDYHQAIQIYENILKTKNDPFIIIKLAKCYEMKNEYEKAEEIYRELLKKHPENYDTNSALVSLLIIKHSFYKKLNYPQKEILNLENEINRINEKLIISKPDNLLGYLLSGKFHYLNHNFKTALDNLKKAYELENKNNYSNIYDFNEQPARYLASCYNELNNLKMVEETLMPLIDKYQNLSIIRYMGSLYIQHKEYKKAETMFNRARDISNQEYNPGYKNNYRLICKKILDENIKLIVMEHPMRNIDNIKKLLTGFQNITFVSNEWNFKNALQRQSYSTYFIDIYAGDFGHCTLEGNQIIAEDLVPFIMDETTGKLQD